MSWLFSDLSFVLAVQYLWSLKWLCKLYKKDIIHYDSPFWTQIHVWIKVWCRCIDVSLIGEIKGAFPYAQVRPVLFLKVFCLWDHFFPSFFLSFCFLFRQLGWPLNQFHTIAVTIISLCMKFFVYISELVKVMIDWRN